MTEQLERVKEETETDLGRAIDADEEHALKMLYYFGKGVKLKAELDAGPEHIRDILPGVMADIDRRRDHRAGVMQATAEFLAGSRSKPAKQRRAEKPKAETPNLFARTER